jgi:hypothetical protein
MSTAYFDAHNHWQDSSFDADRAGITSLLQTLNIRRMVVNGTAENDWPRVQALAANDPSIIPGNLTVAVQADSEPRVWCHDKQWRLRFAVASTEQLRINFEVAPKLDVSWDSRR